MILVKKTSWPITAIFETYDGGNRISELFEILSNFYFLWNGASRDF